MQNSGDAVPESQPDLCGACPARYLPADAFNVLPEDTEIPVVYAPEGYRIDSSGQPVCIHPSKLGRAPGVYIARPALDSIAIRLDSSGDEVQAVAQAVAYLQAAGHGQLDEAISILSVHLSQTYAPQEAQDILRQALGSLGDT